MRRVMAVVLALGTLVVLSACSGEPTGTSSITDFSATLKATASCGQGETCTWYWEYWKAGHPRSSTSVKTRVFGPVNGPTGNIPLSIKISSLTGGTTYDWVFCGSPNNGGSYVCAGPHGTASGPTDDPPADYETFTTPPNKTLAERWDGTSWSTQHTPNPAAGVQGSFLNGVSCTSPAACIAVGYYKGSSGSSVQLAERWDGTAWKAQALASLPAGATRSALLGVSCTSAAACTAVGWYYDSSGARVPLAERWDGTRWTIQPTPSSSGATSSELLGVSCASATACTAVGDYRNPASISDIDFMLADAWDGTTWTIQPIPGDMGEQFGLDTLQGVSCTSATACTAVGIASRPDNSRAQAAGWNGTTWTIEPVPNPSFSGFNTLQGGSCTAATACTAVGSSIGGTAQPTPLAARWDGTNWTIQPTSSPTGAGFTQLSGVSCTSTTACIAVGDYTRSDGTSATLAERWDGTSWTIQTIPSPVGLPLVDGVSCTSATACTAVGSR